MNKIIFAAVAVFFLGATTVSVYAKDTDPQAPKVPTLDLKCLVDVVQGTTMDIKSATEWCTYYVVPGDAIPRKKIHVIKGQTQG